MTKPSQAEIDEFAKAHQAAAHGEHGRLIQEFADKWHVGIQTVHRWLNKSSAHHSTRNPRSTAGQYALTYTEALRIHARLQSGMSIKDATRACRQDGSIKAERINKKTGEKTPLSESAIRRPLRFYELLPKRPLPWIDTFRNRLTEECKRLGLAQVGKGKHQTDAAYLAELAEQGADVLYILTGQHSVALKPDEMVLLDNYNHCNESDKRNLERTASALAKQRAEGKAA